MAAQPCEQAVLTRKTHRHASPLFYTPCDPHSLAAKGAFRENSDSGIGVRPSFAATILREYFVSLWTGRMGAARMKLQEEDPSARVHSTPQVMTALCTLIPTELRKFSPLFLRAFFRANCGT